MATSRRPTPTRGLEAEHLATFSRKVCLTYDETVADSEPLRAFVVRDFEADRTLDSLLRRLKRAPPRHTTVDIPGLQHRSAEILADTVLPGIQTADVVLAIISRPNANVGFELGLALSFGKPLVLAHYGRQQPNWLKDSVFSNFELRSFTNLNSCRALIENDDAWYRPPLFARGSRTGTITHWLCPEEYEGAAFREELLGHGANILEIRHCRQLEDLYRKTSDTARLAWVLTGFPDGDDDHDGRENAVHGVIAGWLYGRFHKEHSDGDISDRLTVLRSASVRPLADLPHAKVFHDDDDFYAIASWLAEQPDELAMEEIPIEQLREACAAQVPREIGQRIGKKYIPDLYYRRPIENRIAEFFDEDPGAAQVEILRRELRARGLRRVAEQLADVFDPQEARATLARTLENRKAPPRKTTKDPDPSSLLDPKPLLKHADAILSVRANCFLIRDRAGSGKTNLLCYLASNPRDDHLALFISAKAIGIESNRSFTRHLEQTLKSALSSTSWSPPETGEGKSLAMVCNALEAARATLLVFIDGINENRDLTLIQEALLATLAELDHHPIRFIVTCRDIFWGFFSEEEWLPFLYQNHPFALPEFALSDLDTIIPKYFRHYGVEGNLVSQARERCRHPLLLRFFCEAYDNSRIRELDDIRLEELFDAYWERKKEEIGRAIGEGRAAHAVERFVSQMVEHMLAERLTTVQLGELTRVTKEANLATATSVYQRLLDEDIIIEELPPEGTMSRSYTMRRVSFVYDEFYDFLAARTWIHQRGWDARDDRAVCLDYFDFLTENASSQRIHGMAEYLILISRRRNLAWALCGITAAFGNANVLCSVLPKLLSDGDSKEEAWVFDLLEALLIASTPLVSPKNRVRDYLSISTATDARVLADALLGILHPGRRAR